MCAHLICELLICVETWWDYTVAINQSSRDYKVLVSGSVCLCLFDPEAGKTKGSTAGHTLPLTVPPY